VIGTPFYMSPEQAKGQEVDGRSDQYSLAVVAFQMIAGRMPFLDESVHTIIYKHIFEDPPSIRELRPDCPAYLATAIHKALSKEPEDRFQSMEDFAGAVMPHRRVTSGAGIGTSAEHVSPDAPTTITPTTGPTFVTPRKAPKKRRVGVAAALVSALLVVGGGTGYWAWQEGYLEQFEFLPSPETSILAAAPEQQLDSAAVADSIAAAAADSLAAARRDSIQRDSLARVTRQLAAAQQREDALRRQQQTPPRETRPQPAPQPQYGAISVNVVPGFGTVYIDDARVRQTPLIEHRVTAAQHIIRIARQGCEDWVDTVRVSVNETVRRTVTLTCGG
jgi:serine/threonine-protein kinase